MNDVAWALQTARGVGPVHPPHAHAHPIHKLHTGPLHSTVAGRTDHLPSNVPNGSYVLPADIVSAMGEGNTMHGFKVAKRMFEGARRHFGGTPYAGGNGPYGQSGGPYGMAKGGSANKDRATRRVLLGPTVTSPVVTGDSGVSRYLYGKAPQNANNPGFTPPPYLIKRADGGETDYRGGHRAPSASQSNSPMHAVDGVWPDFHGPHGFGEYADFGNSYDKVGYNTIRAARGRPNAMVPVYRAVPKHLKGASINPGDWVTQTKDYAKAHGEANLGNNYKLLTKSVPAKHLYTDAGSVHEWGYDPSESRGLAYGGQSENSTHSSDGVPVAVAGGEHVLAPHEVAHAGMGDMDAGHRALDEFVLRQRKMLIKTLKGLPGPKRGDE